MALERRQVRHRILPQRDIDDVVLLFRIDVRIDAIADCRHIVATRNHALTEQEAHGEFEIVAGRAHGHRHGSPDAARDQANLHRFFRGQGIRARTAMPLFDRPDGGRSLVSGTAMHDAHPSLQPVPDMPAECTRIAVSGVPSLPGRQGTPVTGRAGGAGQSPYRRRSRPPQSPGRQRRPCASQRRRRRCPRDR